MTIWRNVISTVAARPADSQAPSFQLLGASLNHGFPPDFCEAADPESKGVVEHLVGYAKVDLVVPGAPWADLETANDAAPAKRLAIERPLLRPLPSLRLATAPTARKVDALSTVRFGSARGSVISPNGVALRAESSTGVDGRLMPGCHPLLSIPAGLAEDP